MPRFEEKHCNHGMYCTLFAHFTMIELLRLMGHGSSSSTRTGCIPDVSFEADEWAVTRHRLNFARSRAASDGCAYAPEHRDRWRAGAGRGSGSLVGQSSPSSQPSL